VARLAALNTAVLVSRRAEGGAQGFRVVVVKSAALARGRQHLAAVKTGLVGAGWGLGFLIVAWVWR
jgi:glutamate 5-kinase